MKNRILIPICFLFLLTLSGCFIGRLFQDTTVKRYRTVKHKRSDSKLVDISVFSFKVQNPKPEDKSKNLWDLKGEGQAKLLEILDKKNESSDAFLKALEKEYLKPKNSLIKDYSTQNLRLVLSISKKRNYEKIGEEFSLADRIEYLNIVIKNTHSGIHFTKWNKFETEYGTLNIGDVTFNESVTLSGGLNASRTTSRANSTAGESDSSSSGVTAVVTPSATVSGTNGIQEVQKLGYRYLALNGKINNDTLLLEQEGIRDIDLAGNIILDVQIKFDRLSIEKFFQLQGFESTNSSGQKVNKIEVRLPEYRNLEKSIVALEKEIRLPIEYSYIYRHVSNTKGAKTFYEWDDCVEYLEGSAKIPDILIMKQEDYLPQIYYAGIENTPKNTIGLFFKDQLSGDFDNIQSLSASELGAFVKYLQRKSIEMNGDAIKEPIKFENYALVSQEEKFWGTKESVIPLTWEHIKEKRDKIYIHYAFDFDQNPSNLVPMF
ncbi:hypothetical protein [Robiginitalea sediminis]|uniref:hypothetical protein n=1 Tax=Robiginitalea sediminis TaxID=1982593 RepID=UPI000B4AB153|nr:hypothetical protein [Robiginitalea sediminis]